MTKAQALARAHQIFGEPVGAPRCFRVIRFYRSGGKPRTIRNSMTEAEAQAWCSRDDTKGEGWFDGYDYMKGCAPKAGSR